MGKARLLSPFADKDSKSLICSRSHKTSGRAQIWTSSLITFNAASTVTRKRSAAGAKCKHSFLISNKHQKTFTKKAYAIRSTIFTILPLPLTISMLFYSNVYLRERYLISTLAPSIRLYTPREGWQYSLHPVLSPASCLIPGVQKITEKCLLIPFMVMRRAHTPFGVNILGVSRMPCRSRK